MGFFFLEKFPYFLFFLTYLDVFACHDNVLKEENTKMKQTLSRQVKTSKYASTTATGVPKVFLRNCSKVVYLIVLYLNMRLFLGQVERFYGIEERFFWGGHLILHGVKSWQVDGFSCFALKPWH